MFLFAYFLLFLYHLNYCCICWYLHLKIWKEIDIFSSSKSKWKTENLNWMGAKWMEWEICECNKLTEEHNNIDGGRTKYCRECVLHCGIFPCTVQFSHSKWYRKIIESFLIKKIVQVTMCAVVVSLCAYAQLLFAYCIVIIICARFFGWVKVNHESSQHCPK